MNSMRLLTAMCAAALTATIAPAHATPSLRPIASTLNGSKVPVVQDCSTKPTISTVIAQRHLGSLCITNPVLFFPASTGGRRSFWGLTRLDVAMLNPDRAVSIDRFSDAKRGDSVSVLDYGADPTGASDSSRAFTAAFSASKSIYVPCGIYLVSMQVSINNFTLRGAGQCSVLRPFNTTKPIIIISGSNFSIISSLLFTESVGTSDGLKLIGSTSNLLVEDTIFYGFAKGAGLHCAMASGAEGSGLYIRGGYSIHNAVGYKFTYCKDFKIEGAQTGNNSGPGIELDHADAGIIANTFAWGNGRAIDATASSFDYVVNSRITQSAKEGIRWNGGSYLNLSNSQFYQNSSTTVGAAPDIALIGVNSANITSNNFLDWTGVAHVNYSIMVDSSSGQNNITGNNFSHYTTLGSTSIASGAGPVTLARNTPNATPRNNWSPIANVPVITRSTGVGGTASTVYLAPFSSSSEQGSPSPVSGLFGCFYIFTNSSPAAGETWTYTARIAGANSPLAATQKSGQLQTSVCSATAAPAVVANQTIDVKVTTNGSTNLGSVFFRGSITIYE